MTGLVLIIATLYVLISWSVNLLTNIIPALEKRQRRVKVLLVMVAAFLIGLRSLGQLTAKDFIAVAPLIVVGYFYLTYPHKNNQLDNHK
jgi:uncharacterized membrane protein